MQNLLKMFGVSVVGLGICAFVGGAYAVDTSAGRAAYNTVQSARAGATSQARMPTMPSLPINAVGNLSPNVSVDNGNNNDDGGGNDDNPDIPPEPECPDGGVKNSEYTVDDCMNDILACINNGALPGGLNDMFNEDLRNAIVNGMGLCATQVDRCITDVRRDCENVYRSSADVWIDFNSRKVQPEYYNFVLRKTGLTPNQAENTCELLDRNVYGSSFNAVSNSGTVTAEYNNRVGAYNSQNGNVLVKTTPQGVQVNSNDNSVDGQRGHYARWDPTTAECWLRVAAYNKDTHIKNSWLFGAAGNDQPAEVWRLAGDTFTCNRDLFGFSLMNQTNTAAVVGIGGGTLLGVGVGAIAGHGERAFNCDIKNHRDMLMSALKQNDSVGKVNKYLGAGVQLSVIDDTMTREQCAAVVTLYDNAVSNSLLVTTDISGTMTLDIQAVCAAGQAEADCINANARGCADAGITTIAACQDFLSGQSCVNMSPDECIDYLVNDLGVNRNAITVESVSETTTVTTQEASDIRAIFTSDVIDLMQNGDDSNMGKAIGIGAAAGAGAGGLATAITAFVERSNINCRVGDGLAQVGYGKSYAIESLKDFYVKWNLNLPDTVSPTATVVDCDSWRRACGTIKDLNQCPHVQINYRPAGAVTTTLIPSACAVSGSECIENYPVAKSFGACK